MSLQNTYLKRLVAAVVQESGICTPTVEVVLPAVFDVIRRELAAGPHHCVMIESFRTFAMIDVPEREHLYTYKGKTTLKHLPATLRNRAQMAYRADRKDQINKGATRFIKPTTDDTDDTDDDISDIAHQPSAIV